MLLPNHIEMQYIFNGNMTEGNHSFLYPIALAACSLNWTYPCEFSEFQKYLIDQISIYIYIHTHTHSHIALVNTLESRQMALGEGMRMILGKWSRDQMRRHMVTLCVACP